MNARFLALIVVYGIDPFQSTSLRTLLANCFDRGRLRIIIWDNSPNPKVDTKELEKNCLIYRSTPENYGLSTIYNQVIDEELAVDEYLILLDQDTVLPTDFLATSDTAIGAQPDIDLFLPMIQVGANWVSPLDYFLGWGRYWPVPRKGRMRCRGICAINSGMIISGRYLHEDNGHPIYDETIPFYGTDTQFMLDFADHREELFVLDVQLLHDLSFFSDLVPARARKFGAMRSAYRKIYAKRPIVQRIAVSALMAAISLLYACRYRSFLFLWSRK